MMDAEALKKRQEYCRQATASAALEGITQPEGLKELDELLYQGKISPQEYRQKAIELFGVAEGRR